MEGVFSTIVIILGCMIFLGLFIFVLVKVLRKKPGGNAKRTSSNLGNEVAEIEQAFAIAEMPLPPHSSGTPAEPVPATASRAQKFRSPPPSIALAAPDVTIRREDHREALEGRARIIPNTEPSGKEFSTIGLIYVDAHGEESSRVVTIQEMHAADQPGEHTTLVCFCHLRREMRTFRLDRVEGFFDPNSGEVIKQATLTVHRGPMPVIAPHSPSQQPQRPEFKTLNEVVEHYRYALERLGWRVELEHDEFNETLACYRAKKRGTGYLKHPSVTLGYTPRIIEPVATADGRIENVDSGPRQRPWSVHGPDVQGRTWGALDRALPTFLKEAGLQNDP